MKKQKSNKPMQDAGQEQQRQRQLLHAVNSAVAVLLAVENDGNVHSAILKGMEIIGLCVGVDRFQIWQNEIFNNELYWSIKYKWISEAAQSIESAPANFKAPYSITPEWDKRFSRGEYISGPYSGLSPADQKFLTQFIEIKSIVIFPLFVQNQFWGFFTLDDCHIERNFTEDELDILRSMSLMLVNVINRANQAEELQRANEYTRLMLDATPLACRIWDRNFNIIDCNEEAVRLFGLGSKQEYIDKFLEFSPKYQPDGTLSASVTIPHINKAIKEGKFSFEWMYQTADGEPLPAEVTLVPVPYEDDFIVAGYTRDLREHSRMMDEIRRQEDLLLVVNTAASVILAADDEKDFDSPLQQGMELMGRCVDVDYVEVWQNEMIGGKLHAVLKQKWFSDFGRQIAGPPIASFPYDTSPGWDLRFSRGEYLNGPVSGFSEEDQSFLIPFKIKTSLILPIFLKKEFWGFSCIDDCRNERSFAEREVDILRSGCLMLASAVSRNAQAIRLRQAYANTQVLLDAMPMTCHLWRKDGSIIDCNEEAVKLFKAKDKQEFVDRFMELSPEYQKDNQLSSELIDLYLEKAFTEGRLVFEWMHQKLDDKAPVPMEATAVRVDFGDEEVVAAYARDLREHKQMMDEIEKRDLLLKAALHEAKDASRAKSSFLANMSHEMRTPLNAVIGLSELTMEVDGVNEETLINLEKINNAGMTLLSTVNDILDISKIEAGKFELVLVEYDTPSLINDAITQSIMRIGEKPIKFVLDIGNNFPARLYGDDLRIKQILNNLLSNAFKYTRQGTVTLGMRCTPEQSTSSEGKQQNADETLLTAWVSDTGPGIKAEDINRLFSDYSMMDTKTNRRIEGTGLGLPITKRIAEMMGGSISVESEYGKGSVFTIKILQRIISTTVIGPEVVKSLKNFNYSDHKRRRNSGMMRVNLPYAKVLVVDDVATNLDVAKGMMKPYGMRVDCVISGQEAIDAIRSEKVRYNAIFMDHMMPEMDGIEATRIIREEIGTEYAKTVPIIALTANAIVGNEAMFLSKGFQAFIPKPIEIGRLDSVIREWVRDKELEKELGQTGTVNEAIQNTHSSTEMTGGKDWRALAATIDGLDIAKGLDIFSGNEETYLYVLGSYVKNTAPLLEQTKVVSIENLADYAIHVHGMKSSNRAIGADILGDKAEALEDAAKKGNINFVMENNPSYYEEMKKLISDLGDFLLKLPSENSKPNKDSPDPELLKKLFAACEKYDIDEVDAVMEEIEACEYSNDEGLLIWLRENVKQMNFKQMTVKLKGLVT